MKADDITEAEKYTSASREIRTSLRKAGYKLLGSGVDATVWAKVSSPEVIKIIMPDHGEGAGPAAETFYKFYQFCTQNSSLENLPKFKQLTTKSGHSEFTAAGKSYIMIAMERLAPIPNGSFQEAMVWILSDTASSGKSWDETVNTITDQNTWTDYGGGLQPMQILSYWNDLDKRAKLEYEILFKLMVLLWHKGKINKVGWDLHTENAMMRGNTIVITDPWINSKIN